MKQKELAHLIQKGLRAKDVRESENCFFEDIDGTFYVCALGAGLVGKFGCARTAFETMEQMREFHIRLKDKDLTLAPDHVDIAAALLEMDFDLAAAIDKTHMLGVPAEAIIQRLKQGTFPY